MPGQLIHAVDDAEVRAVFARLKQRTIRGGMHSVLRSIGAYGKASTQARFRSQLGPDGVAWRPSQRALNEGGQTLRHTSRLRNSIAWQVDNEGVAWGTNVDYAKVHQFGYYKARQRVRGHVRLIKQAFGRKLKFGVYSNVAPFTRRMKIHARRFLGVNDADRTAILGIMAQYLHRAESPS